MISQKKKKIYLIGTNSKDFSDCTLYALETINYSDVLILSRNFSKSFITVIAQKNKKILYEEDLSEIRGEQLWEKIVELFEKHQFISHLIDGDPYIDSLGEEESIFFRKKKIDCEVVPGIIKAINYLNKNSKLLTDRNKNSSVTFMKPFDNEKFRMIINNIYFEKLLIFLDRKHEYEQIKNILSDSELKNKICLQVFSKKEFYKVNLNFKNKSPKNIIFPTYIIIEKHEQI